MRVFPALLALTAICLTGCETTHLATPSGPTATIRQEFVRNSPSTNWEGSYVYGIGRAELGYGDLGNRKGLTLTVDSGPSTLRVFYYAHHDGHGRLPHSGGHFPLFDQTDVVSMDVDLQPNAAYTLHCTANEASARFTLIDLATNTVVATSAEAPVYLRGTPSPQRGGVVPVFIPRHR